MTAQAGHSSGAAHKSGERPLSERPLRGWHLGNLGPAADGAETTSANVASKFAAALKSALSRFV